RRRKDGSILNISLTVSPLRAADGRIVGASKIARDITERKRQQEQQALLVREMRHRIKNTIGTVSSIASQTLTDISPEERSVFAARLEALAGAHCHSASLLATGLSSTAAISHCAQNGRKRSHSSCMSLQQMP